MGALSAFPEAGDAPNPGNVHRGGKKCLQTRHYYRKTLTCPTANGDSNDRSPLLSISSMASNSIVREALYNHAVLIENGVLREADAPAQPQVDNCAFPYYRSNKSNGHFQDAVLVKDAAVSCTLLNDKLCGRLDKRNAKNMAEKPEQAPKNCTIEKYLVQQLKIEYNDLSNITRKISAYTKDILSSLLSRERKKSRISRRSMHNKHGVTSHQVDEMGNPYLRLRLQDDVETQCAPQRSVSAIVNPPDNMNSRRRNTADETQGEDQRIQQSDTKRQIEESRLHAENRLQRLFPVGSTKPKIDSSTYSSSTIYNFLMAGKRQSSKEMPRMTFQKLCNMESHRGIQRESYARKQCKMNSKSYDPVPVTNWKEITRAVVDKSDRMPSKLRSEEPRHKTVRDRDRHSSTFKWKHNGCHPTPVTSNFLRDTNFHTVNIRIVAKKSRH